MPEWDDYIEALRARQTPPEPLEIVRTCAERGWGPLASCWVLRHALQMPLSEAKGLTHTLCAEHGLQAVYEVACKAKDPDWPHGRK